MEKLTLYIDGSCLDNPGYGAYGCININTDKTYSLVFLGVVIRTTSYAMELRALLKTLLIFKNKIKTIYCDNLGIVNGFKKWIIGWEKKNYKDILYAHLWKLVYKYKDNTELIWIKAHNKNRYNEIVDNIVCEASKNLKNNMGVV